VDKLKPEHRSWNMSRIRSSNTKPELIVRSILHRMGFRFRLHRKDIPGKPDIVLPKYKTVIFVHGCFWHRHEGCKYAYTPKSRVDFWTAKFKANTQRDIKVKKQLDELKWNTFVIWECELSDINSLETRIQNYFSRLEKIRVT